VKIRRTKTFDKTFLKLPAQIQQKTEKAVKLLLLEFYHPSLHTKKMSGQKDIWEARVDYHYRFTFTLDRHHHPARRRQSRRCPEEPIKLILIGSLSGHVL
jgi:mRNA-degrading endonuclease RelE of RelBE toxin-antitoxin system